MTSIALDILYKPFVSVSEFYRALDEGGVNVTEGSSIFCFVWHFKDGSQIEVNQLENSAGVGEIFRPYLHKVLVGNRSDWQVFDKKFLN
jgi:hypothetical protein